MNPRIAFSVVALGLLGALAVPPADSGGVSRWYAAGVSNSPDQCGTLNLQPGCVFHLEGGARSGVSVTLSDGTFAKPMFQAAFVSGGYTKTLNCVQSCSVSGGIWSTVTVSLYPAGNAVKLAEACHWCGQPPTWGSITVTWS